VNPVEKLAEYFARFPGIGPRQAQRFVYFLLKQDLSFVERLAEAIRAVRKNVKVCAESYLYFYTEDPDETLSPIARSKGRDRTLLMVVEKDSDLLNIERSGTYHGQYFVLGGLLPLIEKKSVHYVRTKELVTTIKKRVAENLSEVILALSANPDGEYTAERVRTLLEPLAKEHGFSISMLGRGLSTGTELEYSDTETIKSAFAGRA